MRDHDQQDTARALAKQPLPQPPPKQLGEGARRESALQAVRDKVVAHQPVGHSVSPAQVIREFPGTEREMAVAYLAELAKRGVLKKNPHHPNFYEVQQGHGASRPGANDTPQADIREGPWPPQEQRCRSAPPAAGS